MLFLRVLHLGFNFEMMFAALIAGFRCLDFSRRFLRASWNDHGFERFIGSGWDRGRLWRELHEFSVLDDK